MQKRQEGGKGGGHPSNVLQDYFFNSSNSGVKIARGGDKAYNLGNYNVYEFKFLQCCHFNCIFPRSVQHGLEFLSRGEALRTLHVLARTLHVLQISST